MEGGGKPLRGRMGGAQSEGLSEAELAKLRKQIDALGSKLDAVKAERAAAQSEARELQKEAKRAQTVHNKQAGCSSRPLEGGAGTPRRHAISKTRPR